MNAKTKNFSKIDKLIVQTARQYNLETALYKAQAMKYWQEVAGSFLEEARHLSKAIDLKKGVLSVACLSRELAARLRLLAGRIIAALNQLLGRQVIFALNLEL